MTLAKSSLTLAEFLDLPETEPASEYIDGEIQQKPMPKTKHSRLQLKLCNAINDVAESALAAYAFPELRCTFGHRSIVPDIAVLLWPKIQWDETGEPVDDVKVSPDWIVEILSPGQSPNRVTQKILYCLEHGTQLGWMLDPSDRSILVFVPNQLPIFYEGGDRLPVLTPIALELTCDQIFGWLKMNPAVS
ncbi:Uma2 family endonuclease [Altericista sp. CCNU0014]|uniref:Uma2 family endonuclease n=1 Tax=Altericista sp. CCNU0014 TaxID=3082949 RepID=UPI0038500F75